MTTIAVMQPYFAPYAGYFRLIQEADIFVVYDCVQFPRRGWVHRNKLENEQGQLAWLTLPLEKQPQETLIQQLRFPSNAQEIWSQRVQKYQHLNKNIEVWEKFQQLGETPSETITAWLKYTCELLNISTKWICSSELNIENSKKGKDRILEIVKKLGGKRYINAPGGIDLYDSAQFEEQGIELKFLSAYQGQFQSIFQRLLLEEYSTIFSEIEKSCSYQN